MFLSKGDYEQALETYRQAEALAPNDAGIKANLALAHYRMGDPVRARQKFAEAERIDPGIRERHQRLGAVLSE